jgi:hypothetical protein
VPRSGIRPSSSASSAASTAAGYGCARDTSGRSDRPSSAGTKAPPFAHPCGQGIVCCGAPCKANVIRMLPTWGSAGGRDRKGCGRDYAPTSLVATRQCGGDARHRNTRRLRHPRVSRRSADRDDHQPLVGVTAPRRHRDAEVLHPEQRQRPGVDRHQGDLVAV